VTLCRFAEVRGKAVSGDAFGLLPSRADLSAGAFAGSSRRLHLSGLAFDQYRPADSFHSGASRLHGSDRSMQDLGGYVEVGSPPLTTNGTSRGAHNDRIENP